MNTVKTTMSQMDPEDAFIAISTCVLLVALFAQSQHKENKTTV
jgi:hypothetical protein